MSITILLQKTGGGNQTRSLSSFYENGVDEPIAIGFEILSHIGDLIWD